MGGRANPLMDRKVVGVVFFGVVAMVAVVTSPQVLDVVWCSVVVVAVVAVAVVYCNAIGVVVVVFVVAVCCSVIGVGKKNYRYINLY